MPEIAKDFNKGVNKGVFPDDLKHTGVTSVHKKKDKSDKTNYRPVSVLANISKTYENYSITNFMIILMTYYLLVNVVFARGTVRKIVYLLY